MGDRITAAELNALRGRRWTAAEASRILKGWRASGLSMSAFGRQFGLAAQRLGWWKKRLADWGEGDAVSSAPQLVPAVVRGAEELTGTAAVAIRLRGVVLEVADPRAVEPAWIAAVVGTLSRLA